MQNALFSIKPTLFLDEALEELFGAFEESGRNLVDTLAVLSL